MHSGRFRHRPAMFWKAGNVLHVAIMLMYSKVKRTSHRDAQSHRDAHSRAPRRPPPDSSCYTPVTNCCARLGPGTRRGALDERFKKLHGCSVVDHVSAVTMREKIPKTESGVKSYGHLTVGRFPPSGVLSAPKFALDDPGAGSAMPPGPDNIC